MATTQKTQQLVAEVQKFLEQNNVHFPTALPNYQKHRPTSSTFSIKEIMAPDQLARVLTGERPLVALSCGFGQDSVMMAVALIEGAFPGPRPDIIMHANVGDGDETPETYATFEFYKRWFEDHNVPVVVVENETIGKGIFQYHLDKKILPSRKRRDCTGKFKIAAMRQWLRREFGTSAKFVKLVGYNADESDRVQNALATKNPSYEILQYPLVDANISRADEAVFLQNMGLPPVQKSGCFFCPFTRQAGWIWLYVNHRELYDAAQVLEDQSGDLQKGWTITSRPKWAEVLGLGSLAALRIRIERKEFAQTFTTDERGRLHCERDVATK